MLSGTKDKTLGPVLALSTPGTLALQCQTCCNIPSSKLRRNSQLAWVNHALVFGEGPLLRRLKPCVFLHLDNGYRQGLWLFVGFHAAAAQLRLKSFHCKLLQQTLPHALLPCNVTYFGPGGFPSNSHLNTKARALLAAPSVAAELARSCDSARRQRSLRLNLGFEIGTAASQIAGLIQHLLRIAVVGES